MCSECSPLNRYSIVLVCQLSVPVSLSFSLVRAHVDICIFNNSQRACGIVIITHRPATQEIERGISNIGEYQEACCLYVKHA